MKTNTVIASTSGERIVTSTVEQLDVAAKDLQPGDWVMRPHHRGFRRDKLVSNVSDNGIYASVTFKLHGSSLYPSNQLIRIEREWVRK